MSQCNCKKCLDSSQVGFYFCDWCGNYFCENCVKNNYGEYIDGYVYQCGNCIDSMYIPCSPANNYELKIIKNIINNGSNRDTAGTGSSG